MALAALVRAYLPRRGGDEAPSARPGPDAHADVAWTDEDRQRSELRAELVAGLASLTPYQRAGIVLLHAELRDPAEVAAVLGRSPQRLDSALAEATVLLRRSRLVCDPAADAAGAGTRPRSAHRGRDPVAASAACRRPARTAVRPRSGRPGEGGGRPPQAPHAVRGGSRAGGARGAARPDRAGGVAPGRNRWRTRHGSGGGRPGAPPAAAGGPARRTRDLRGPRRGARACGTARPGRVPGALAEVLSGGRLRRGPHRPQLRAGRDRHSRADRCGPALGVRAGPGAVPVRPAAQRRAAQRRLGAAPDRHRRRRDARGRRRDRRVR